VTNVGGVPSGRRGYSRDMTENPVDPVHDDHGDDQGENPDGSHDQDAEPPTPFGEEPDPETSGTEHPDPPPGDDGS
jgi:hypothetical protein